MLGYRKGKKEAHAELDAEIAKLTAVLESAGLRLRDEVAPLFRDTAEASRSWTGQRVPEGVTRPPGVIARWDEVRSSK